MRHWAWIDEIVGWSRRRQLTDAEVDRNLADVERRYVDLVRGQAALLGHRPSEVADAFGGYLCACGNNSWLRLDEFDPLGGCTYGWELARRALKNHHDFGHRNDLQLHNSVLCRTYGCAETTEEDQ